MKINWGHGILIGMGCFICFILFFVIKMSTDKKYEHDLVVEEYYHKEMAFQEEIDAEKNTGDFSVPVTGERTSEGWLLHFPEEMTPADVNGKVFLYRPSNKQLDFELPLVLSGSNLLIPDERLLEGRWNITVAWKYNGKAFLYKKAINY